jgi:hypothetical protein
MAEPTQSERLTTEQYLVSKGWTLVRTIRRKHHSGWQAWNHPNHQHSSRGFFQKSEALDHQRRLDKGFQCDCIQEESK